MSESIWEIGKGEREQLERLVAESEEAVRTLESPLIKLGIDAEKLNLHRRWEQADPTDTETLMSLKHQVDALNALHRQLTTLVDQGKLAKHRLEKAGEK